MRRATWAMLAGVLALAPCARAQAQPQEPMQAQVQAQAQQPAAVPPTPGPAPPPHARPSSAPPPPAPTSAAERPSAPPAPAAALPAPPPPAADGGGTAAENDSQGYVSGDNPTAGLLVTGYVDVGFAKAQGDGTSFAPGDQTLPADYGVDGFAPAVNSRGDVASTDARGRFTNGFLPRSVGIGGKPSFLLNTLDVDLRYVAPQAPLLVFTRLQFLPRFTTAGDDTHVLAEQAFGRLTPFDSAEFALFVGKFDSVFGIEYLDNQANLRTGITPSLIARYTTGTSTGAKAFYRVQIPALWSAVSLNAAATNSGTMIEALQGPDRSLTGEPVVAGRLGYELNLPALEVKLGASGLRGPRNDQQSRDSRQRAFGADARLVLAGLTLAGEYLHLDEDAGGSPGKQTGAGSTPLASEFHVRGGWAQASWGVDVGARALRRITAYGRFERRHAWFEGFTPITVERVTCGARLDLWDTVALKGEVLLNREIAGAPDVANDVYTSSLVYSW